VILEEMHDLDCTLAWHKDAMKPELELETPSEIQSEILKEMGYVIKAHGSYRRSSKFACYFSMSGSAHPLTPESRSGELKI